MLSVDGAVPFSPATVNIGQYAGVAVVITTAALMHDHPDGAEHALGHGLVRFAELEARYGVVDDHALGLYGALVMSLGRMPALFCSLGAGLPATAAAVEAALRGAPAHSLDAGRVLGWVIECADQDDQELFYRRVAEHVVVERRGVVLFEAAVVLLYALALTARAAAYDRLLAYGALLNAVDRYP